MDELPTRDRLVFAAMKLFGEKGYLSTSVQDILREAGANAGSLYHAFPTKQDVLVAVLDLYRQGIEPMLLAPAWDGVADPIEKVFALLARYRGMLEATDCLYGCPIGSIALELHEPDPPVRELLSVNFTQWVGHVERCLVEAGDRLPPDVNRHVLATLVLNVMEGGVMQARTHRSLAAFDASVAGLRDYIARLEQAASAGRATGAAGGART
ncbi:TetR/AcrR family transcriptional regulator [Phenylobacterium sp.]|uniref:TetR/AcrR family transcriptional regulator n=1 Tax=Phenylobacterium sp. TaxID=1871053 RepID=UPI00301D216A